MVTIFRKPPYSQLGIVTLDDIHMNQIDQGKLLHPILFTGWWFGTWFLFFHSIGKNHPN